MSPNSEIYVEILGKIEAVLIDTGAQATVISQEFAQEYSNETGIVCQEWDKATQVLLPNGNQMRIQAQILLCFKINEEEFKLQAIVLPDLTTKIVLGRDFLQKYGAQIDYQTSILVFYVQNELRLENDEHLVGGKYTIVSVNVDEKLTNGTLILIKAFTHSSGVMIAEGLTEVNQSKCQVGIYNPHPGIMYMPAGEVVGLYTPVMHTTDMTVNAKLWNMYIPKVFKCDSQQDCVEESEELTKVCQTKDAQRGSANMNVRLNQENKQKSPVQLNLVDTCMNEQQKAQMVELVQEYRDIFVGSDSVIGNTKLLQHHIRTIEGATPIASRPYRVDYKSRKVIEDQVADMLDKDVIQPSVSPWSAPVVLVPKPDGSLRFCIDFRRLNSVTILDQFPLPDIRQSLEIFGTMKAKWFSSLDLQSAYWQVSMCPKSAEKTAFITTDGLWQFKKMPFGLSGAPMTFSRLMAEVLKGLLWKTCLVYLDDILIFTDTFERHLVVMREVFERLRGAGLKLSTKKCFLGRAKVKYLGHIVSADGIETNPKKISAVKDAEPPTNVTQVRQFLGLAGYYRRYVQGFSEIAKPLHDLTRIDHKFEWGPAQEKAFQTLKEKLTQAPILMYPLMDGTPFIVQTDASDYSVGYVLSQIQDELERVICYGGRSLTDVEQRYSTPEKEFLAVVYAIHDCDCYLRHTFFTVVTDHQSLKGFITKSEPKNARHQRHLLSLQPYSFEIQYKPGKKHSNADFCSRQVYKEQGIKGFANSPLFVSMQIKDLPVNDWAEFIKCQQQDPELKEIYQYISSGEFPEECSHKKMKELKLYRDDYIIQDGILYHLWIKPGKGPQSERTQQQLVVPREYFTPIMESYHDHPLAGHHKFPTTYTAIHEKYYWPKMRKYIQHWIDSCESCARADKQKTLRNAPLQIAQMHGMLEKMHADIVGPLVETEAGYKYILTMVDQFSRWVEVIPLKSQTAIDVAEAIFDGWICRFGVPKIITTDRGRNFMSGVVEYLNDKYNIKHITTSSFTPKANGVNERRNAIIVNSLRAAVTKYPHTWDKFVAATGFSLRNMVCSTTGRSPYELVMGIQPQLPIDNEVPITMVTYPNKTIRDQVLTLENKCDWIKSTSEMDQERKQKYKEIYDKYAQVQEFQKGQKVWCYTPGTAQKLKSGKKMTSHWAGPYRIVQLYGKDHCINAGLKRLSDDIPVQTKVHVNRLKPVTTREKPVPPPIEIVEYMDQGDSLKENELEPGDIVEDSIPSSPLPKSISEIIVSKDSEEDEVSSEEEYYEVETILEGKYRRKKEPIFLVRWKGYDTMSWEPFSHLNQVLQKELISCPVKMKGKSEIDLFGSSPEAQQYRKALGYIDE